MGKLIDELKAMGYEFQEGNLVKSLKVNDKAEEVDVHELRVKSQEGQIILLKRDMTPMLFPGKDIDGVRTTCGDVYRDFYELDDEATSMLLNNYSLRTYNYLKKREIALVFCLLRKASLRVSLCWMSLTLAWV